MPQIIPIRDLKNTAEISELCRRSNEPVFVTKNGYGDMVIMSMETYEKMSYMNEIYSKIAQGEQSIKENKTLTAEDSLNILREENDIQG